MSHNQHAGDAGHGPVDSRECQRAQLRCFACSQGVLYMYIYIQIHVDIYYGTYFHMSYKCILAIFLQYQCDLYIQIHPPTALLLTCMQEVSLMAALDACGPRQWQMAVMLMASCHSLRHKTPCPWECLNGRNARE